MLNCAFTAITTINCTRSFQRKHAYLHFILRIFSRIRKISLDSSAVADTMKKKKKSCLMCEWLLTKSHNYGTFNRNNLHVIRNITVSEFTSVLKNLAPGLRNSFYRKRMHRMECSLLIDAESVVSWREGGNVPTLTGVACVAANTSLKHSSF